MATHYADREEFFDGNIVVFRRGDAVSQGDKRFYSARFKLDGRIGYKFVSLRTRNYVDAVSKAKSLYLSLSQSVKDGASIDNNRLFKQVWKSWYESMVSHNVWTDSRRKWHLNYFHRYFQAYFGDKKLDEITEEFGDEYFEWRKGHSVYKDTVSYTTLKMEQSALNQFFHWCYSTKRLLRFPIKLKVKASQREKTAVRRASFDNSEWNVLTRNLLSWADETGKYAGGRLTSFHRHHRQQLRFYVLFLGSTGIRSGTETRFMRWSDISSFKESDGSEHLKIRIRAETKKGVSRTVISQPNAVGWLKTWRSISHYPGDQDLVWYGQSKVGAPQVPAMDLNRTFQSFLRTVEYQGREGGLINDPDGGRRSLYSLRHFYASQRVLQGVSYEDLSRQLGTGLLQLSRHYDHVLTEQRASAITQTRFKGKKDAE